MLVVKKICHIFLFVVKVSFPVPKFIKIYSSATMVLLLCNLHINTLLCIYITTLDIKFPINIIRMRFSLSNRILHSVFAGSCSKGISNISV